MRAEEIPAELMDMLDEDAGRVHSRTGSVACSLARILTRYEEMLAEDRWEREQALPAPG
jgi:hypothetical protein